LDWFDFTDADAGVTLLRTAPLHAEYSLKLPPGWRDLPAVRDAANARIDAATAGLDVAAQEDLDYLRWMPSPRDWWRLAFTPTGDH
jgi:hypothetical protein